MQYIDKFTGMGQIVLQYIRFCQNKLGDAGCHLTLTNFQNQNFTNVSNVTKCLLNFLCSIIGSLILLCFCCCEYWYFIATELIFSCLGEKLAQVCLEINPSLKYLLWYLCFRDSRQESEQIPKSFEGNTLFQVLTLLTLLTMLTLVSGLYAFFIYTGSNFLQALFMQSMSLLRFQLVQNQKKRQEGERIVLRWH